MQEARERAGGAVATRLLAAMTAAFALGQLLGPLIVGLWADAAQAMRCTSLAAAALLVAASSALLVVAPRRRDDSFTATNRSANA